MSLKDEYFSPMTSQFKRWDAEFGMLSEKGGQLSDAAAALYVEQLKTMQANRDAAYRKLQEIRKSSESAWRGLQTGVDEAWVSMKHALDQASSRSRKQP